MAMPLLMFLQIHSKGSQYMIHAAGPNEKPGGTNSDGTPMEIFSYLKFFTSISLLTYPVPSLRTPTFIEPDRLFLLMKAG